MKYNQAILTRSLVLFSTLLGASICHAKDLNLNVTGSVTTAYDDNITYSATNRLEDFVTSLKTGLELNQQGETHQLFLKADVMEQIFATHDNFNNTSEDFKVDYKQDFSQYDHLELKDSLVHAYQPTSFDEAFGRVTGRYSTLSNQAGISYTHDFSEQFSGEVHYDDLLDAYSQTSLANSFSHQAGMKVIYTRDSANIFDATYDYTKSTFENGPSAIVNSILTDAKHYFTPQFYVRLGAGPDFIDSFNGESHVEPHYVASLTDQADKETQFSLTYEKQDFINGNTEDLFNSWRTSLNCFRQFNPRWSGYASVFYGQGRYDDLSINEDLAGVFTNLNYAVTPRTKLALGYSYSDSVSNNSGYGYWRNYIYFSATMKF